jgi:hypothetical protein
MSTVVTVGAETRVNSSTNNEQNESAVTRLNDGGYVVAWQSNALNTSDYDIYLQRYNSAGVAVGAETRVNTSVSGLQLRPAVTSLSDGGYVVTWDAVQGGVFLQRFSAAGSAVGGETRVDANVGSIQVGTDTTALSDGGYVVTWTSPFGVSLQRYNSAGAAVGGERQVSAAFGADHAEVAALSDGGWVVTWTFSGDVFMRRYDAIGVTSGVDRLVNTATANGQLEPTVAALSDGGYVVAWTSALQDGSGRGVYLQRGRCRRWRRDAGQHHHC